MKKTEIFFPYEPRPKGRPRFTRTGRAYTPKTTHDYEKVIRNYYKDNTEDYYDTAIEIKLTFYMPIPQTTSKKNRELMEQGYIKCTKRNGDIDNLAKAILDAMNGVAFEDDCFITKLNLEKKYTSSQVGTAMVITEDVE